MPEDVEDIDEVVHLADNVDEFAERMRLQHIHEARQEAASALREARFEAEGGGSLVEAREYARGAVEAFVLEVEALYKRLQVGQELWEHASIAAVDLSEIAPGLGLNDKDIMRIESIDVEADLPVEIQYDNPRGAGANVQPPAPLNELPQEVAEGIRRLERRRNSGEIDGAVVYIDGVGSYVDGLSGRATAEVAVEQSGWANSAAKETQTRTSTLTPPVEVSREVYRATNALLSESDIGVKLGIEDSEAETDYTDLDGSDYDLS